VNTVLTWVVVILLALHGLIHLMGFVKEWKLAEIPALTGRTLVPLSAPVSRVLGAGWLVAAVALLAAAGALALGRDAWLGLALAGVALSQLLIVAWWHDARFGTIANVLLLGAVVIQLLSRPAAP
jgi:hypothetical protein